MHVFFSGIGGTGIGPLSLIAAQAGYRVSGSDKQDSTYIHYLQKHGIADIHIGQSVGQIAAVHDRTPIDWYVYSSAVTKEQADPPELRFCKEHGIKTSKRDVFLSQFLDDRHLKLIAIAGTHGKTTTTAMTIWLLQQLDIPLSYSVGAKLSFGDMGAFDAASEYFVYECDEYDRNFLAYRPFLSLIAGIDWDHADVYPTREVYYEAFRKFISQSQHNLLWDSDAEKVGIYPGTAHTILREDDPLTAEITLPGMVNRLNATLVAHAIHQITGRPIHQLVAALNRFPGVSRRFEQIAPNIYSEYAHTPPKIMGALQLAHEVAGENVVVVYEGLHNTRQHFIKHDLKHLFDSIKKLYIVPSYLAREDPNLPLLSPADLKALVSAETRVRTTPAALNARLRTAIAAHATAGDTVLCITAGGGGSLDEWLRKNFST